MVDVPSRPGLSESLVKNRRLLLLSNSRNQGQQYLEHARDQIRDVLGNRRTALFIPYASVIMPYDEFTANVGVVLADLGYDVHSLHRTADPRRAIAEAEAIVVGGGNTFQLLNRLYEQDLLSVIQERVAAGVPYIGWSAGANVACPSIRTTNDMPIVETPTLNALKLVPFQINPHFIDFRLPGDPAESKVERLMEFVAVNADVYVVAMRDGTMLRVDGTSIKLEGSGRVRVFVNDRDPLDFGSSDSLEFLLGHANEEFALSESRPFGSDYARHNPRPRRAV